MIGYPSVLNSKEDFEYVRNNFPVEEWINDFKNLLETTHDWFFVNELASKENGIEDETHKVLEEQENGGSPSSPVKYSQYEYRLNPTCKLLSIGYTIEEVKAILEPYS